MLLGKKVSGAQDRVSRDLYQKVISIGGRSQKVTCYFILNHLFSAYCSGQELIPEYEA